MARQARHLPRAKKRSRPGTRARISGLGTAFFLLKKRERRRLKLARKVHQCPIAGPDTYAPNFCEGKFLQRLAQRDIPRLGKWQKLQRLRPLLRHILRATCAVDQSLLKRPTMLNNRQECAPQSEHFSVCYLSFLACTSLVYFVNYVFRHVSRKIPSDPGDGSHSPPPKRYVNGSRAG